MTNTGGTNTGSTNTGLGSIIGPPGRTGEGYTEQTASNVASSVSDTASNVAGRAQETVSNLAVQAQYQARGVQDRVHRTLQENPLAVGVIALALGFTVGLSFRETHKEHELMGETRDYLMHQAQDVAQDTMEKVQRVASDVVQETKQLVARRAQEEGLTGYS